MPPKVNISAEFLRERYHDRGWTMSRIADEVGCSVATVHNRMEEHGIERRNPRAWKERITVECANCGTEKQVQQFYYDTHDRFFCDNQCQGEFLKETGLTRGENNGRWKEKVVVKCANCGIELETYPCRLAEKENHLCDQTCRAKWYSENLSGENHPLWLPGGNRYSGDWLAARRQVRDRDGNVCQLCGKAAGQLGQVPDVHHIRPVRNFEVSDDAHVEENLVQLCRTCHPRMEQFDPARQRAILRRIGAGPFG